MRMIGGEQEPNRLAEKTLEGVGVFLDSICMPAAKEYGLLLKDKVHFWRAENTVRMLIKAQAFMGSLPAGVRASPGTVYSILEEASGTDDDELQSLWAGLLASACSEDGKDESNKLFVNLLRQMTPLEVRILILSCERAVKIVTRSGAIGVQIDIELLVSELMTLLGVVDFHQLDRELDHMRQLGLFHELGGGIQMHSSPPRVEITPSSLALQMYVRCKGSKKNPIEYFHLEPRPDPPESVIQPVLPAPDSQLALPPDVSA